MGLWWGTAQATEVTGTFGTGAPSSPAPSSSTGSISGTVDSPGSTGSISGTVESSSSSSGGSSGGGGGGGGKSAKERCEDKDWLWIQYTLDGEAE